MLVLLLSINFVIVQIYIYIYQIISTSLFNLHPPLLSNSVRKTEPNTKENLFLKHRPDVGKGIFWSSWAISSFI